MCYIVHKYLLVFIVFFTIRGISLSPAVDLAKLCFRCGPPQPRSIRVDQEIPKLFGLDFAPHMTVLHRCDGGSGCCYDLNKSCSVISSELLNATVYLTRERRILHIQVKNHTRCFCQDVMSQGHK